MLNQIKNGWRTKGVCVRCGNEGGTNVNGRNVCFLCEPSEYLAQQFDQEQVLDLTVFETTSRS